MWRGREVGLAQDREGWIDLVEGAEGRQYGAGEGNWIVSGQRGLERP